MIWISSSSCSVFLDFSTFIFLSALDTGWPGWSFTKNLDSGFVLAVLGIPPGDSFLLPLLRFPVGESSSAFVSAFDFAGVVVLQTSEGVLASKSITAEESLSRLSTQRSSVVPASPFCGIQPNSSYNLLLSWFNKLTAIFYNPADFLLFLLWKTLTSIKILQHADFL